MASSGKKGKKNKGIAIPLQSFLSNGVGTPAGTTQVAKKVRNFDGDDSDDSSTTTTQVYQLPTAPRASRVLDDDSIPNKPPFLAFVTNLPFDIQENDFQELFGNLKIVSVRLPREDGEGGRIRGFGYVEFGARDDLIEVLTLPDPQIKGRRIRIEVSNGNEPQVQRMKSNRRAYDGFGNFSENRESTNWRENNRSNDGPMISNRGSDRSMNRDSQNKSDDPNVSWRSGNISRNEPSNYNERYSQSNRQKVIEKEEERPKLNLKPRSLPLPSSNTGLENKPTTNVNNDPENATVSSKKVFGAAKPVDTVAKELEVGDRIAEARRKEKLQQNLDKKESQRNGNRLDSGFKESNKVSTITSWRSTENSTSAEAIRKTKSNSNNTSREKDVHDNDGIRHSTNSNRIQRSNNSSAGLETDIKSKLNLKTEGKIKNTQPESAFKSSNKYSELDEE